MCTLLLILFTADKPLALACLFFKRGPPAVAYVVFNQPTKVCRAGGDRVWRGEGRERRGVGRGKSRERRRQGEDLAVRSHWINLLLSFLNVEQ